MKKLIIFALIFVSHVHAQQHEEVFMGTGSSSEAAKQNAYRSISAQGKSINSFVSSETRRVGTNNYITVFKIKTR
jgi:hypothetical protein